MVKEGDWALSSEQGWRKVEHDAIVRGLVWCYPPIAYGWGSWGDRRGGQARGRRRGQVERRVTGSSLWLVVVIIFIVDLITESVQLFLIRNNTHKLFNFPSRPSSTRDGAFIFIQNNKSKLRKQMNQQLPKGIRRSVVPFPRVFSMGVKWPKRKE